MKRLGLLLVLFSISFTTLTGQPININGIEYVYSYSWKVVGDKKIKEESAFVKSASATLSGNVTIPSQITYKGKSIPVTVIYNAAFSDCSQITSIVIPSSVHYIQAYAFQNCTGLTNIKLPTKINGIGNAVFFNCCNLESVELPRLTDSKSWDKRIRSDLFNGCSNLVYVKIPQGVEDIETLAFKNCDKLTDIFCYPTKAPSFARSAFGGTTNMSKIRIHVSKEALSSYQNSNWNQFKSIDTNMARPQIKNQPQANKQSPQTNSREAIDMGGSVEWANMNLESTNPTETGGIFAWGETDSKTSGFTPRNYSAPQFPGGWTGYEIYTYGLKGSKYDAARIKWGNGWRLPTKREFEELIRNCKVIPHSREKYVEIVASNGNKLILPNQPKANITYNGIGDFYWTSDIDYDGSICYDLYFGISNKSGYYGGLLRPVRDKRSSNNK